MKFEISDKNNKIQIPFTQGIIIFNELIMQVGDLKTIEIKLFFRLNNSLTTHVIIPSSWQDPMDKDNVVSFWGGEQAKLGFEIPECSECYIESYSIGSYKYSLEITSNNESVSNPDVEVELNSNSTVIDEPFNPQKIDITSKQMILEALFKRIKNHEINLFTGFQRQGDLWDNTKQSRLIESILIRFPLPAFYFDGTDDDKWLVVDGLQRISSLKNFVIDKKLKLENLEFLKFNGKGFDDLPRDLQRRIEESTITVYIINPGTPEDVKYNIFKRINTGGLVLEPQEIRHAINQGIPAEFVAELANLEEFKKATTYSIKSSRMLDRDFVTRFISFYINNYKEYVPDLDTFMNKSMSQIKSMSLEQRATLKKDFIKAMITAISIFGNDAFRKRINKDDYRKPINKALFETWSVCLSKLNKDELDLLIKNKKELIKSHIELMVSDPMYFAAISSGTGDKNRIGKRFSELELLIKKNLTNDNFNRN